jgi:pyruvate-formate lyase
MFVALYICTEKDGLITESFKETERQPEILGNVKEFAHVLNPITIFIEDGDLITDNAESKPNGFEFGDLNGLWAHEQIAGLKADEGFTISEEDEEELRT